MVVPFKLLQNLGFAADDLELALVEFCLRNHFDCRLILSFRVVIVQLVNWRQVVQAVDKKNDAELSLPKNRS